MKIKGKDIILGLLVLIVILLVLHKARSFMDANEITPASVGNIIVYGSKECPWCVKQEKYLTENGFPYTFVDCRVGTCPDFVESFPTLLIDDKVKTGYTELGPPSTYPSPSNI